MYGSALHRGCSRARHRAEVNGAQDRGTVALQASTAVFPTENAAACCCVAQQAAAHLGLKLH
ncbi:hypothetical protein XAP412_960002 [Xanthomonas phaseoli pv. phaseoli]|uniref:Uncharacterized protein n=1 Tax=Xanthomonas campestris pv. phaseoli TaxID=317013 RepID=A0AB38E8M3_XANCH|nr:hypothetical protein XAP6984_990002 [Xanthomonas phaseoli pv. phaseoli]SON91773.1 hypothetical protein XAP412_960002 [Xanthomonas phaseoli pv. phaseoli]SON93103.1 hypothetical protein XAP7430_980002 [Xanthomonas phaseoli pv. phaseoli]